MRKIKLIFCTVFITLSLSAFSQVNSEEFKKEQGTEKGYIITNTNEYKSGYIRKGMDYENSKYIYYYKFIKATPIKYNVDSIKEYGYDDIVYENIKINGKNIFLQRLNNKKPYLYYLKSSDKKEFYLKEAEDLKLLPSNKKELVKTLRNDLDSCKEIENTINFAMYNKSRLISIFKRYDECSNKRIPYFKIGISTGLDYSTINFKPDYFISYVVYSGYGVTLNNKYIIEKISSTLGSNYGIFLDIPMTYKRMRLSFRPEIDFSIKKYEASDGQGDLSFDISYTNVNLFLRNNSLKNKVSFYMDYGLIFSSIKTSNVKIDAYEDVDLRLNNILYGIGLGCGVDIPVFKRNTLNIGVKGNLLTGDKNISSLYNAGLYLGLSF
ncbi:MAG: hypothetical protein A2X13_00295 [Bacteroidetes bacterium GWC2_33_15]|nr:MAG: hypothetical protein A2X10_04105 [Bacteroidetes bacterium GWA2_33_15]OFX51065.1 MAG: hypothetical protein A2X13_00295 [Bacteroidetes bacterium GWC2_33_15]OFX66502.1 MAG: hypothetical protein A2X15_07660 [Bacteroidetes bacterium GWB2_32_14]OFX70273.1 MAG: hypothetical protein A2X14_03185 [Bacteroidetes bacterium GWD2_33_33]HAN17270.1 hypothetical protein [Bacteroidales bacterium]